MSERTSSRRLDAAESPLQHRAYRRWRAAALVMLMVLTALVTGGGLGSAPAASAADVLGAGGEFHPVDPLRVLDTRDTALDVEPAGKKSTRPTSNGRGTSFDVPILGEPGLPTNASDILAVVLNVTVVAPDQAGWAAVYPTGASVDGSPSSVVNYKANTNVPNVAIVGLGDGGRVSVELFTQSPSRAHVVIDMFGFISTSSYTDRGARFVPAGPGRIYDSRDSSSFRTDTRRTLQIRGADTVKDPLTSDIVPNRASVEAVMLNLTVVNNRPGSTATYASVVPEAPTTPDGRPATSNVNVPRGEVKASMVIVPIGSDGKVHLFNRSGDAHLVVDVLGYFETGAAESTLAGRIVPLDAPFRALDTRTAEFGNVKLGHGQAEQWSFKNFVESVRIGGEPAGKQSALIGNLTGVNLTPTYSGQSVRSYLAAYPGDVAADEKPTISNLNLGPGGAVPNASLLRYGAAERDGGTDPYVVWIFNAAGSVHYLLDVQAIVLAD